MAEPFIEIQDLSKVYKTAAGDFQALDRVNIRFDRGELVAVIGKSGSGKSTFINMLSGIDRPTSGSVRIGRHLIHELDENGLARWRGRNLGIVFQFFKLLPTLTVIENVMMPMELNGLYTTMEREKRAKMLLEKMEVSDHLDKLPGALSGGQQQRVAIARALANDPPFIIADEPTGNLDSRTAEAIFQLFRQLVSEGKTILMVTHDDTFARLVDRTVIISDGQVVNEFLVKALRQLSRDLILEIKETVEPVFFEPGETIIRQGEKGDLFYIILEGNVEVLANKPGGGGEILVAQRQAGSYFGSSSVAPELWNAAMPSKDVLRSRHSRLLPGLTTLRGRSRTRLRS
jgi:ABC-type lipoprotein export system ATPase subunit